MKNKIFSTALVLSMFVAAPCVMGAEGGASTSSSPNGGKAEAAIAIEYAGYGNEGWFFTSEPDAYRAFDHLEGIQQKNAARSGDSPIIAFGSKENDLTHYNQKCREKTGRYMRIGMREMQQVEDDNDQFSIMRLTSMIYNINTGAIHGAKIPVEVNNEIRTFLQEKVTTLQEVIDNINDQLGVLTPATGSEVTLTTATTTASEDAPPTSATTTTGAEATLSSATSGSDGGDGGEGNSDGVPAAATMTTPAGSTPAPTPPADASVEITVVDA